MKIPTVGPSRSAENESDLLPILHPAVLSPPMQVLAHDKQLDLILAQRLCTFYRIHNRCASGND